VKLAHIVLIGLFGSAATAGMGAAQEAREVEASAPQAPKVAPRNDFFEPDVDVPDAQKPARSRDAVAKMREILTRVIKLLEEAREERDVVKLNCVNEKLTAIKGLLRVSEQADVLLQEALARRDTEISSHEFEKIMIAEHKSDQLATESEGCVGEQAVYAGDTEVEVVIEGGAPEDTTDNFGGIEVITRPPAASPYQ